jgi:hypothetical protein
MLALAPPAEASPRMGVECVIDGRGSSCVFTNQGSDRGEGCTVVHLTNEVTGRSTDSDEICSGDLGPGASTTVAVTFPDEQPSAICLSETPRSTWSNCEHRTILEASPPLNLSGLVLALALLGSLAVFLDARRIGARRDLGPGILRFPPSTWAAGCLIGLFIPLIWYLRLRPMIKATADYLPGGLTPPPYARMMADEAAKKSAREETRSARSKR